MKKRQGPAAARRRAPQGSATKGPPVRRRPWWLHPSLASSLLAVALFLPSLPYAYTWDDHTLVEQNTLLRSPAGVATLLRSDFALPTGKVSGQWRPWIVLTYALDHGAPGAGPGWLRAMNVGAHALASALVAALALQWGAGALAALAAGAAFATLPAHVESVVWISGRTDVYCTLFLLLALLLDRRARRRGAAWCGPWALAAAALALASKEAALGAVALVALAEWLDLPRTRAGWGGAARWVAPYAALTAAFLAAHAALVRAPAVAGAVGAAMRERAWMGAALLLPGELQFLWPGYAHSPAATLDVPVAADARVWTALLVSLLVVAGAIALAARRRPAALPVALFLAGLAPLVAVNVAQGYLLFGERYTYLPSAGAAWALGAALAALPARARGAGLAAAFALALWGAGTALAIEPDWRNDMTLFESMARKHPENYMARVQWARQLAEAGRTSEAGVQLDAAERLDPRRPDAAGVRAVLAAKEGDWTGAVAAADRALAMGSIEREPRLLRIVGLLSLGRLDEARADLERLRAGGPPAPSTEVLWGQYLVAAGRPAEATASVARAMKVFPEDADLAYTLGLAANAEGRPREAASAFERAVALRPEHYDAWLSLAASLAAAGDRAGCERALASARALPAAADGRADALARALGGGR